MADETFLLKKFSQLIAIPLYNTDGIKWPIRSGFIINPVCDIFALEYISQLDALVESYETECWNKAFPNSLSLWRFAHHTINGLEKAGVSKDNIAKKIQNIIRIITVLAGKHCFEEGKHCVLTEYEINTLLDYKLFSEDTDNYLFLKLSALLWAYSDALYFQGREVCCEYHGPYDCRQGTISIIRDYKNFCPSDLWPELTFDTTYKHIRIITIHDGSLKLFIDAYNNISIIDGNFSTSILGGILLIDGQIANRSRIKILVEEFTQKLAFLTKFVGEINEKKLFEKYLHIFWYRKKQLADFLDMSWTPPQKAIDIINSLDIVHNPENPYSKISMTNLRNKYDYSYYVK